MGKRKRKRDSFEEVRSDFPDDVELDRQLPHRNQPDAADDIPMHQPSIDDAYDPSSHLIDDDTPPSAPPVPAPSARSRPFYLNLLDFTSQVTSADNSNVETALTRFSSQVKAEYSEHKSNPSPLPTDVPSPLLHAYLQASPEAVELFSVFDRSTISYSLLGKAVDSIHVLLSPRYHPSSPSPLPGLLLLARRFLKTRLKSLYKLLHLADTRLPLSALRLLHTLASLSPSLTRELVHSFNLSHKAFLALPLRPFAPTPRPSLTPSPDPRTPHLTKLRTAYIDLLLLLLRSDPDVTAAVLSIPRYPTSALRHLGRDEGGQVRRVLEAVMGVVRMRGVGEEAKGALVGAYGVDMLVRLWGEGGEGEEGGRHAGLAEEFFTGLVGWVREEHSWSIAHREFGRWKFHKQLLTRILTALHPSTSAAQRTLAIGILQSFPSLLPGYLSHVAVSFEPRLSVRWVENMGLLSDLLSIRLDPAHLRFLFGECTTGGQVVHHVMSHVFPQALTRALLMQAVQHKEIQVRLVACRTLVALLHRYLQLFAIAEDSLSSRPDWTQWASEVTDAMRKHMPDVQLVFQMRVKIWPASPSTDATIEADAAKAELYEAVLNALQAYDRALGVQGIDLWKLLLITPPSPRATLSLLHLLQRCDNSPRMFHVAQPTRTDGAVATTPSYFGLLLRLMVDARSHREDNGVHTQAVELIVKVLARTGFLGEGDRAEVLAWLEAVDADTVAYVEQLLGYVGSKVYAGSAAAAGSAPYSPLLRAALSPAWSAQSTSPVASVIGLLCFELARLLSLANPQRSDVASAILHLPTVIDDHQHSEEKQSMKDNVSTPDFRNDVLPELILDPRFLALTTHAASLTSSHRRAPSTPKRRRAQDDAFFELLTKLTPAQWDKQVDGLVMQAETGSARVSLRLFLAVNADVPLLSLPRVRAALTASGGRVDSRIASFIQSLPPSTLLPHASKAKLDVHYALTDDALASVYQHWATHPGSEPERLSLIAELTQHALALLAHPTPHAPSPAPIVLALLEASRSLVLPVSAASTPRLATLLGGRWQSRGLLDFAFPASSSASAVSADVTRVLASLARAVLEGGDREQVGLVQPFLQRLVDACVALATSPPPSVVLPLALELLEGFAPHVGGDDLARLSTAFVSSAEASQAASQAWLALLSGHPQLAQLLLAPRPGDAFRLIASISEDDRLTHSTRDSLDSLLLQLLEPVDAAASPASTASVSTRAYLVPESLFSAALAAPSPARLRIADFLLQSTAFPVYARLFADNVAFTMNLQLPLPALLSLLPCYRSYVIATSHLPVELLPVDHERVLGCLERLLRVSLLPALLTGEADVVKLAKNVDALVHSLVLSGSLQARMRTELLSELLVGVEHDIASSLKRAGQPLSPETFNIARRLLQRSPGDAAEDSAELSAMASVLLLRALATLTKLFKAPAGDDPFEKQLMEGVTALLGGDLYLPTISLPSLSSPPSPTSSSLSHLAPHMSYESLQSASSAALVVNTVTRCITSGLRSRFSSPSTHRLVFLLLTLQLSANERTECRQSLSLTPASLLRTAAPSPPDLSPLTTLDALLTAHTLFDLVVSHSQFVPTFLPPDGQSESVDEEPSAVRIALVHLLYLLFVFPASPAPTPPPASLIALLSSAYSGTYTAVDLTLQSLFSLLAASSKWLLTPRVRWGEAGRQEMRRLINGDSSATPRLDEEAQWVYTAFTAHRLQQGPLVATAPLRLPSSSVGLAKEGSGADDARLTLSSQYSAAFVLPFFLHLFKHGAPDLKKLIDLGALSYALVTLSHPHVAARKAAYRLINRFFTGLTTLQAAEEAAAQQIKAKAKEEKERAVNDDENTGHGRYFDAARQRVAVAHVAFKEAPEVLFLLSTLKNSVVRDAMYVPAVVANFLGRAVWILMRPQHRLYRAVNRFIALRPAFAMDDVPMFYQMFSSGAALDWKMHRSWILRLLTDSTARTADWVVLKRRHVLPILMAFHDSRHADRFTRLAVLDLIKRLACTGGDGDAVEGVEELETAPALPSMLRRHALVVWLRAVLDSRGLSLQTLQPAMELASVVATEIHRRLPNEPPTPLTGEEPSADVAESDAVVSEEDEEEGESLSDEESQDEADSTGKAQNGHAGDESSEEDEEEEVEEEGAAVDRVKSARDLSRRRVAMAQDLQLLFSTLLQRTTDFIHQHILTHTPASTLLHSKDAEHQQRVGVEEESDEAQAKAKEELAHADEARLLSFGSSSSSLATHVATLSQAVSLLRQLQLASVKARMASGVDTGFRLPTSAVYADHSYLDIVIDLPALSALYDAARLLNSAAQEELFRVIVGSRPGVRGVAREDGNMARVLEVVQWSWGISARAGAEAAQDWLRWMLRLVNDVPMFAAAVLDSRALLALLRSTYAVIRPSVTESSEALSVRYLRGLRLLRAVLFRLDAARPPPDQLVQRAPANSLCQRLRERFTSHVELTAYEDEADGKETQSSALVEEQKLALLLQDFWWETTTLGRERVGHYDWFLRARTTQAPVPKSGKKQQERSGNSKRK